MIGTRCNRKPSGLKGNDAVKDHVAENGNNTSQSVKKPKDDFISTEGRNAESDKYNDTSKRRLTTDIRYSYRDGTGVGQS